MGISALAEDYESISETGRRPKRLEGAPRAPLRPLAPRLLVIGPDAESLAAQLPSADELAVAVTGASDVAAVRAAFERARPDGVVLDLLRGASGTDTELARLALALLPPGIEVVVVVDASAPPEVRDVVAAIVVRRRGEAADTATLRALEVCRALVSVAESASLPPSARLEDTHRRLLARMVDAQLGQAMVVHDLRTPLNVLQGIGVALESGTTPARVLPIMGRSLAQIECLLSRLEELHASARSASRERIDLSALVHGIAEQARVIADAAGKAVHVHGAAFVPLVADRHLVERAISNLVSNAVRHARARVDVHVTRSHGVVRIAVLDDGAGIRAALRADLFRRYVRDPVEGRLGLGLAIVRVAADRLNGRVAAFNRAELRQDETPGACFILRLPR